MTPRAPTPARPTRPARRVRAPRTPLARLLPALALACAPLTPLAAAELPTRFEARQVNDDTVGIVFHYEDVYRRLIEDMTAEFAGSSDVRIVPIIGLNHVQTIYDMLYMRGVDLGIVHSDVFAYLARTQGYERVYQRISALAEITTEKVAVIAGEAYRSLEDLAGEKVNFQAPGKGSDVTGTLLFDAVGVEVEPTRFTSLEALEKVKSGEIAAMVYSVSEPVEPFASLSPADGIRLIGLPQSETLLEHYRKTQLGNEDFPELIKGEGAVPSLELAVIIAAYNWTEADPARYEKSRRFATALLDGMDALKGGDSAGRWESASLERTPPGVPRLAMLDEIRQARAAEAEREAIEAAAARAEEVRASQQALVAQLAERLESGTGDPDELAELERLIEQMRTILEE